MYDSALSEHGRTADRGSESVRGAGWRQPHRSTTWPCRSAGGRTRQPRQRPGRRERHADGLILVFTLADGLDDEERRLRDAGVEITMPLREEPWGERLFQVTDPNGVIVRFVEWVTRGTQEQAG
ncbi:hypothetical protein SGLAM104S_00487 [Streptomyces glaucescens]